MSSSGLRVQVRGVAGGRRVRVRGRAGAGARQPHVRGPRRVQGVGLLPPAVCQHPWIV